MTTDQIHVGVPYVFPSSRKGEMCRSSATAILRSSSLVHVFIVRYFAKSLAIFLVTYFLHPLDRFSIQLFLNSNVRHAGSCRGSVPVFLTRRNPDKTSPSRISSFRPPHC